jgi:hypothetical protein
VVESTRQLEQALQCTPPIPETGKRPDRPVELAYALDERPPWLQLLALGFQHVSVICPYLVMVGLVAEAAKLPREAAQSAVGLSMIAVAFMTVLQSFRLRFVGSGYLVRRLSQPFIYPRAWRWRPRSGSRVSVGW